MASKKPNNLLQYGRNVGRSLVYTSVDAIKEMNPVLASFADTNAELSKEVFSAVKDYKGTIKKTKVSISENQYVKLFNTARKNFVEDLSTGNWYNREREESLSNNADFDEDDWSWSDESDNDSETLKAIESDTDRTINTMNSVSEAATNAIAKATITSADYMARVSHQGTKSILDQNKKHFAQVNLNLSAVNSNLINLVKLGEPITTHINNSANFYTRMVPLAEENNKLLKEILAATKANGVDIKKKPEKINRDYNYVVNSKGALDVSKYMETIKHNVKNKYSFIGDLTDLEMGGANVLEAMVAMPVAELLKEGITRAIPKGIKKASDKLNQTLADTFSSLFMNLHTKANDSESPEIFRILNDIFGINMSAGTGLKTDLYEKGKVNFDGITRQSIVTVIPTYLAQILAAVSGEEEKRYNYKTGKFEKISSIQKAKKAEDERYYKDAVRDFKESGIKTVDKLKLSKITRQDFEDDFETFLKYLYDNAESFSYKNKDIDASKYGISPESLELIRTIYKTNEKSGKSKLNTNLNTSILNNRSRSFNARNNANQNGDDIFLSLINGSLGYNPEDTSSTKYYSKLKSQLLVDNKGNDIFFYLQDYYKQLGFITTYMSRSGTGGNGNNSTPLDIHNYSRNVPINIKNKVNQNIENENKRKEREFNNLQARQNRNGVSYSLVDDNGNDLKIDSDKISDTLAYEQEVKDAAIEAKENQNSIFNKLREARTVNDKFKTIVSGIEDLANKPAMFLASVLQKADERLYNVLYSDRENNEEGFVDLLKRRLNDTFDEVLNKSEDLWEKTKKGINGFMKKSFGFDMGDLKEYVSDVVWGKDNGSGEREGGVLGEFVRNTKDSLKDMFTTNISDPFNKWVNKHTESAEEQVDSAATGGKVTKTGVIAVTGGEYIIPAPGNKKDQLRKENEAKRKFINSIRGKGGNYKYLGNYADNDGPVPNTENGSEGTPNVEGAGRVEPLQGSEAVAKTINDLKGRASEEIKKIIASYFGSDKESENVKENVNKVIEESGIYAPNMAAGALVGGGFSLLTGMVGGPLLGAAIGAAGNLVSKSEKVQTMLFGEKYENGEYKSEIGKFMDKKAPDMVKYGLGGGLIGSFFGGPVVGTMIGAALGYAKNTEEVKNAFFGKGAIAEGLDEKIKKALPKAGAGAVAGMLFGPLPIGIVGNAMVGAAIGFASNSEKFKEFLFGKEDENKKRNGGLVGTLKKNFADPLVDFILGKKKTDSDGNEKREGGFIKETASFFKDEVFGPIKELMDPIKSRIRNKKNKMAEKLKKKAYNAAKKFGGHVVGTVVRRGGKALGRFGLRAAEKLGVETPVRAIAGVAKLPFRIAGGIAGNVNNRMRTNDTISGNNDYEDFETQLQRMQDLEDGNYKGFHPLKARKAQKNKEVMERVSDLYTNNRELLDEMAARYRYSQDGSADVNEHAYKFLKKTKKDLKKEFDAKHIKATKAKEIQEAMVNGMDQKEFVGLLGEAGISKKDNEEFYNYILNTYKEVQKEIKGAGGYNKGQEDLKTNFAQILGLENLDKGQMDFLMNMMYSYSNGTSRKVNEEHDEEKEREATAKNNYEWDEFWKKMSLDLMEKIESGDLSEDAQEKLRDLINKKVSKGLDINKHSFTKDVFARLNQKGGLMGKEQYTNEKMSDGINELVDLEKDKKTSIEDLLDKSAKQLEALTKIAEAVTGNDYTNSLNKTLGDRKIIKDSQEEIENRESEIAENSITNKIEEAAENAIDNHALGGFIRKAGLAVVSKGEKIIASPLENLVNKIYELLGKKFNEPQIITTAKGGIIRVREDADGEPIVDMRDRETQASLKEADEESNLLNSIKNKLSEFNPFSDSKKNKKEDDEEKPEDEEGESLIDKLTSLFSDDGKSTLSKIKSALVNIGGPLLVIAGFGGALDKIANKLTNGAYGDPDKKDVYYDKDTEEVLTKDEETGEYYDKDGNKVDRENTNVGVKRGTQDTFQEKLIENTGRGLLTGQKTLVGTVLKKSKITNNKVTQKIVGKASKIGHNIKSISDSMLDSTAKGFNLGDDLVKSSYIESIKKNIDDVFAGLKKVPILKKFVGALDNIAAEISEKVFKKLSKGGAKTISRLTNAIPVVGQAMMVAFALADFTTGYQDARSTLGITAEPSFGQRIVSGVIRTLKNLIPVVGSLIPDSLLVDICCNYIAPVLGIDVSELQKQRADAQAEVDAYNAENNTNLSVQEYNKQVLNDYTWTEKIGNSVKTGWNNLKDGAKGLGKKISTGWSNLKENVKNSKVGQAVSGFGEDIKEHWNTGKEYISNTISNIKEKGILSGGLESIKNLGEITGMSELLSLAKSGDIKGFISYVPGKQEEDGNSIMNFAKSWSSGIMKIGMFPTVLISAVGNKIKNIFGGIIDKVKGGLSIIKEENEIGQKLFTSKEETHLQDYLKIEDSDPENPMGGFEKVVRIVSRISGFPMALIKGIGGKIKDVFVGMVDKVKNHWSNLINIHGTLIKTATEGDPKKLWNLDIPDDDEGNPLGGIYKGIFAVDKIIQMPTSALFWVGGKIKEGFTNIVNKVKNAWSNLTAIHGTVLKTATEGDPKKLWNLNMQDDNGNPLGGIYNGILSVDKILNMPTSALFWVGGKIKEGFTNIVNKVKNGWNLLSEMVTSARDVANQGDPKSLLALNMEDDEGNPLGGFSKGIFTVVKYFHMPSAALHWAANKIKDAYTKTTDAIKDNYATTQDGIQILSDHASEGDISSIWKEKLKLKDDDPLKGIWNATFTFNKIMFTLKGAITKIVDGVKDIFETVTDKLDIFKDKAKKETKKAAKKSAEKALNAGDGVFQALKDLFGGTDSGSGSGLRGSGTAIDVAMKKNGTFVSQVDPALGNSKFTKNTTIADNGCAPAVAAMVVNSRHNNAINLKQAAKFATAGKYANDDGTDSTYFKDFFSKFGINTNYIENKNSTTADNIRKQIAGGNQVVLLGKDGKNKTKTNSPFGANDHYVLATGVDKSGNIIVNDPETNKPKKYSSKILKNVKLGISTNTSRGSGSGIGMYRGGSRTTDGSSVEDTDIAQQTYAFFTSKGYSPEATAAIMGNMEKESYLNPTTIQGGSNHVYTDGDGSAGGIVQWESRKEQKGRWKAMADYAASKGYDWTALEPQLEWVDGEIGGNPNIPVESCTVDLLNKYAGGLEGFKSGTNIDDLTEIFMNSFERPKESERSASIGDRRKYATQYYNLYSGKTIDYVPNDSLNPEFSGFNNGTTSGGVSNTIGGIASGVAGAVGSVLSGNIFSDAIDNAFKAAMGPVASALMSLLGFGSSNSENGTDGGTTTINGITSSGPDPSELTGVGAQDIVTYARSKIGKMQYKYGSTAVDQGYSDCSGFAQWAVKKATGIDPGRDTGAIYTSPLGADVSVGSLREDELQPGDLLLYKRKNSTKVDGVGHVEIYDGEGHRIGNGGPNDGDIGATEKDISSDASNFLKAKRFATMEDPYWIGKDETSGPLGLFGTDNAKEKFEKETKGMSSIEKAKEKFKKEIKGMSSTEKIKYMKKNKIAYANMTRTDTSNKNTQETSTNNPLDQFIETEGNEITLDEFLNYSNNSGSGTRKSSLYRGGSSGIQNNTTTNNTTATKKVSIDVSQFATSPDDVSFVDAMKKKNTNNMASVVKALGGVIDQLSSISANTEFNAKIYELLLKYLVEIASGTQKSSNTIINNNGGNNSGSFPSSDLSELSSFLNMIAMK